MTQTFQDPPEKIKIVKEHHERVMRHINRASFKCPWCGVQVTPVFVDREAVAFASEKLHERNVSVGVRGLFLNPGVNLRAHHRSCEGYGLHRKDLRRFRRPTGFGFGADKDELNRDWGMKW